MSTRDEKALEHAWRYFALHAEQRTTVFNFFAAAAGLALSGLAYVLSTASARSEFGLAAGIGAMLIAMVFWKLDQRVAQLTKCAEEVLIAIEGRMFDAEHRVFTESEKLSVNVTRSPFAGVWSYGRSFRILFASVAGLGFIGFSINAYRLIGPLCGTSRSGAIVDKSSLAPSKAGLASARDGRERPLPQSTNAAALATGGGRSGAVKLPLATKTD